MEGNKNNFEHCQMPDNNRGLSLSLFVWCCSCCCCCCFSCCCCCALMWESCAKCRFYYNDNVPISVCVLALIFCQLESKIYPHLSLLLSPSLSLSLSVLLPLCLFVCLRALRMAGFVGGSDFLSRLYHYNDINLMLSSCCCCCCCWSSRNNFNFKFSCLEITSSSTKVCLPVCVCVYGTANGFEWCKTDSNRGGISYGCRLSNFRVSLGL